MSRWTMQRHLHRMGYQNILSCVTHMLTREQKEKHVISVMKHKNDDWNRTVFSDKPYFQLFRNTVRRWSKTPQKKLKRIPKNKKKVMVSEAIGAKDKISCHPFRSITDGPFYIKIIFFLQQDNSMHNNRDCDRTMIQNIEVKLPKSFWIVKYQKISSGHPTVLTLTRWRICGRS